jgi:hypothetical protein
MFREKKIKKQQKVPVCITSQEKRQLAETRNEKRKSEIQERKKLKKLKKKKKKEKNSLSPRAVGYMADERDLNG